MEWDEVHALIKAMLAEEWDECPVSYQNEDFQAPYGTPWVYAALLPVDGDISPFNSTGQRIQSGIALLACTVMVPTGTGVSDAFAIAKRMATLLRRRTLAPGIETGKATVAGADDADDEGNFFMVSTTAEVFINTTV